MVDGEKLVIQIFLYSVLIDQLPLHVFNINHGCSLQEIYAEKKRKEEEKRQNKLELERKRRERQETAAEKRREKKKDKQLPSLNKKL